MDKQFHPTLYWALDYISMLRLKFTHVIKMGPDNKDPRIDVD